jgi:hypothetical protein
MNKNHKLGPRNPPGSKVIRKFYKTHSGGTSRQTPLVAAITWRKNDKREPKRVKPTTEA